jgi:hypothetical protein
MRGEIKSTAIKAAAKKSAKDRTTEAARRLPRRRKMPARTANMFRLEEYDVLDMIA